LYQVGLSLKKRIFFKTGKIMEKGEANGAAIAFICKVNVKDYFTV